MLARRIIALAAALYCLAPTAAQAQCTGQAAAGTICLVPSSGAGLPRLALPSVAGLPTLSGANTWTGLNTFTTSAGGIALSGFANPSLTDTNLGLTTRFGELALLTANSATVPEGVASFNITSGLGSANLSTAFKIGLTASAQCNSGSADCWAQSNVITLGAGGTKRGGIGYESDLNQAWVGNYSGSPSSPYAANFYATGINTGGYASFAFGAEFAGNASPMWERAFHVGPAGFQVVNTAAFEDESNSPTVFKVSGSHTKGMDLSAGAFSGNVFEGPGFSVNPSGHIFSGSNGFSTGTIVLAGLTSGAGTVSAQAVAGAPAIVLPTSSGTLVATASAPCAINATTGNLSCTFASNTLTSAHIFVGNGSNVATDVAMSGDISITNAGVTSLIAGNAGNLNSGTLLAARMPALTGDVTTSAGAVATTLATVNSNVGTFGSVTQASQVTVNAKGLITAAANVTITPAVGSITGLGTGVATALGINVGSAGALVTNGGALGTPSSGTLTNATGYPASALAGSTLAAGVTASSLTSVGTLTGGATGAGFTLAFGSSTLTGTIPIANGGCNSSTGCVVAAKETFVTSSQTVTRATGIKSAFIVCWGAGGGGAGAAASAVGISTGGGGGGGSWSYVNANAPAASYVVTIGASGAGGATGGNNGSAGGDTTVVINGVTVCVGKGGSGGTQTGTNSGGPGGAGGVPGTGDFTTTGQAGVTAIGASITTIQGVAGIGGNGYGGGAVAASLSGGGATNGGSSAANTGAGGGGGVSDGSASTASGGGGGSGGVLIVEQTNQ